MFERTLFHASRIGRHVRRYGPRYLIRAPMNELRNPRLGFTRWVRSGLVSAVDLFRASPREAGRCPDECLVFAFDLGCAPVTFDFATFLAGAELERRRRGLARIFVVFIPGSYDGLRRELPEYESAIAPSLRHWRKRHIVISMLTLLPTVQGYAMCPDRETAGAMLPEDRSVLFPADYRVWLPRQPEKRVVQDHVAAGVSIWPMFRSTDRARQLVAEFLASVCRDRRAVVITLRASAAAPRRNSRVDEWAEFARGLDRRRFTPIFVDDSEAPIDGCKSASLAGETFCDSARWNVEIRMALYEAAWLNLAVMHGPMELCWYSEASRYVLFLEVGTEPGSSEEAITEGGARIGADLQFATPFQHVVWGRDDAATIATAFDAMAHRIELAAEHTEPPRRTPQPPTH